MEGDGVIVIAPDPQEWPLQHLDAGDRVGPVVDDVTQADDFVAGLVDGL
jgi:hypothetical protein